MSARFWMAAFGTSWPRGGKLSVQRVSLRNQLNIVARSRGPRGAAEPRGKRASGSRVRLMSGFAALQHLANTWCRAVLPLLPGPWSQAAKTYCPASKGSKENSLQISKNSS